MIGKNTSEPTLFQMINLDALVPPDHRLRQIDAALDLDGVRERLAPCYAAGKGRPGIDPELALRMMVLGILYDFSDRKLCEEIQMHAGFRWFCRLNFHDPVPDHSTLSRLRNERWAGSDVFDHLFESVVATCVAEGMVSGRHVSVDGTQVRARASMKSLSRTDGDDEAQDDDDPDAPSGSWQGHGEKYSNDTHASTTDPDAKLYRKSPGQGATLSYLVHDIIDTTSRVILGRHASTAHGRAEREAALTILDEHEERRARLGLTEPVGILTGDTGYGATEFVTELLERGITPHVPLLAKKEMEELPTWKRRTFNLAQYRKRKEAVQRAEARNTVRAISETDGYRVSRKLRNRSEHIFAEAKQYHGMARARYRGLQRVELQCKLTAIVQNLKRLVAFKRRKAAFGLVFRLLGTYFARRRQQFQTWIHARLHAVTICYHMFTTFRAQTAPENVHCSTRF